MKTSIVIVGGGTAGWLTAAIIAAKHCSNSKSLADTHVTLIESPNVKNLGVGEGTWPTMRDTLRQIGISEGQFLSCCDASFKQASKFINWSQGNGEHYYHPFTAPAGYGSVNMADHWCNTQQEINFEPWSCSQGTICDNNLAPKLPQMAEYGFALNYGYHLNAGKFVALLHQHCIKNLNVNYVQGHVEHIVSANNGDISDLVLTNETRIAGDLFIDCSGFAAVLMGKHYHIPFVSKRDILFNDTALALQVDHTSNEVPIASSTLSTAQHSGWIWDIALQNRRGIGHVFSSEYISESQAEQVLLNYVKQDKLLSIQALTPKKIKFTPGHRETFWHKNCVAIGVSAGFVEPLEATALVLIEKSAQWISEQLPRERNAMSVLAKRFNQLTSARWQEIIDFLKLHYILSARTDSEYWKAHQQPNTIPDSLKESLLLWRSQAPNIYETNQRFELFSSASKQYVLYGMGFNTAQSYSLNQNETNLIHKISNETQHNTEKLLGALPSNRYFLTKIAEKYNNKRT